MKREKGLLIWRKNQLKQYEKPNYVKSILKTFYKCNIIEVDELNSTHDIILQKNSTSITVEIKERLFSKDNTVPYFYRSEDLLIELFQHRDRMERSYTKTVTPKDLFTAFGWFWKTQAEKLIYISYYDEEGFEKEIRIWDVDMKNFKSWLLDNAYRFDCSAYKISNKSTISLNISVPINMLPGWMYTEKRIKIKRFEE